MTLSCRIERKAVRGYAVWPTRIQWQANLPFYLDTAAVGAYSLWRYSGLISPAPMLSLRIRLGNRRPHMRNTLSLK